MAKNKMKVNYKRKKRERNKEETTSTVTDGKNIISTFLSVFIFILVMYLCFIGLEHLGIFDAGYTAPQKEIAEIDANKILIGSVFNRDEKTYYVLFDSSKEYESHPHINRIVKELDKRVYFVDMSEPENAKHISEEVNKKATSPEELKINGLTLIKIKNGKISKYISGVEDIEEFVNDEK